MTLQTRRIMRSLRTLPESSFSEGTVISYFPQRGFGFIGIEGQPNHFFNVSNCTERVSVGQRVRFVSHISLKGRIAVGVHLAKRVGAKVTDAVVGHEVGVSKFNFTADDK